MHTYYYYYYCKHGEGRSHPTRRFHGDGYTTPWRNVSSLFSREADEIVIRFQTSMFAEEKFTSRGKETPPHAHVSLLLLLLRAWGRKKPPHEPVPCTPGRNVSTLFFREAEDIVTTFQTSMVADEIMAANLRVWGSRYHPKRLMRGKDEILLL